MELIYLCMPPWVNCSLADTVSANAPCTPAGQSHVHTGKMTAGYAETHWLPVTVKGQELRAHPHGDVGASRLNF